MLSHDHVVSCAGEAEALIEEARRLQRRRRRRAGVVILVLGSIAAGTGAFAGFSAGGGGQRPATARPASPGQIRAFLAAAERATSGTFSVTYSVTVGYADGSDQRADVAAAQSSVGLFYYRETPSLRLTSPGGAAQSKSYEVFSAVSDGPRPGLAEHSPHGLVSAGPGLFSCARGFSPSSWSCIGPDRGIGMGTTGELTGPYPPQALLLGLQNAAEIYTGQPAPPATQPQRAFLFTRRLAGRALSCLGFGSPSRPLGTVCLEPDGIIASYQLPTAVSSSGYQSATLRGYAPTVGNGTFTLPAVPHRYG
jgi:hypothetical protein